LGLFISTQCDQKDGGEARAQWRKKLSNGNVVNLFGADLQKVRKAIADLESPDNDVFKEAYHWVFIRRSFLRMGLNRRANAQAFHLSD